MPDDIRIPPPNGLLGGRTAVSASYRARRGGPDAGRLAMLVAAGVGAILFVGVAGWAVMGRRPAVVPLIEADSSPIRIKPENPGGMQVAGADETDAGGTEAMAPAAEAPAPQALRAQMQQGAPEPAPSVAAPALAAPQPPAAVPPPRRGAIAGSAPPAQSAQGVSPLPDTALRPTRSAATPMPAAPPAPVGVAATAAAPGATARSGGGGVVVQLGALGSEAAARAEWDKQVHSFPDALGGHRPQIEKTEHDGHTLWRLRTGGFADTADATGFCAKLRAKGGACTIAAF